MYFKFKRKYHSIIHSKKLPFLLSLKNIYFIFNTFIDADKNNIEKSTTKIKTSFYVIYLEINNIKHKKIK